jgi:hypothetical protein
LDCFSANGDFIVLYGNLGHVTNLELSAKHHLGYLVCHNLLDEPLQRPGTIVELNSKIETPKKEFRGITIMDKMKFETLNLTAKNAAKIAALFPGVVNEGKVNMDLLRSMLGEDVFSDEAYEFTGRKPLRAVFRDSGFIGSPEKINVFEIFKLLAPNTKVRVI